MFCFKKAEEEWFRPGIVSELASMKERCCERLNLEIQVINAELVEIETCYSSIRIHLVDTMIETSTSSLITATRALDVSSISYQK